MSWSSTSAMRIEKDACSPARTDEPTGIRARPATEQYVPARGYEPVQVRQDPTNYGGYPPARGYTGGCLCRGRRRWVLPAYVGINASSRSSLTESTYNPIPSGTCQRPAQRAAVSTAQGNRI